jgi:hypothetical protein
MVYKMRKDYINTFRPFQLIWLFRYFRQFCSELSAKGYSERSAIVSVGIGILLRHGFCDRPDARPRNRQGSIPFLHHKLTLNFVQGLWAELIITIVLFAVSAFTEKTDPVRLKRQLSTTQKGSLHLWDYRLRLHLGILTLITVLILIWLK